MACGTWHGAGLRLAILLTVVFCAIVASLSGPVGPMKAHADTPLNNSTLIDNSSNISRCPTIDASTSYDIFGYVLDSKGNKVPNAHVLLYTSDSLERLSGNPIFSGNGDGDDPGYYGFSGIDFGNYTIRAETVDALGNAYNGTARVKKAGR